jgi:hypothetical protein
MEIMCTTSSTKVRLINFMINQHCPKSLQRNFMPLKSVIKLSIRFCTSWRDLFVLGMQRNITLYIKSSMCVLSVALGIFSPWNNFKLQRLPRLWLYFKRRSAVLYDTEEGTGRGRGKGRGRLEPLPPYWNQLEGRGGLCTILWPSW